MASAAPEIYIAVSPDEVWELLGDFGDIGWMPGVDSCTLDGDVRTVGTMGIEVQEQLVAQSDDDRMLSYTIVAGPVPVESHLVTISVRADGDGSLVVWEVTVTPDDALGLFEPIYAGSLKAIKSHLEAASRA